MADRLRASLWVVPMACLVAAVAMALAAVELDTVVEREAGGFGFAGGASSARGALSAIASSMLTFTGFVFSVTILTLQLTSSQFSPRALRNFLRDRTSQLALGIFLATFVYALMVLREVRGEDGVAAEFVPGIAVSVAFAFVGLSVVMFVRYIHHITQSIRVVNIIDRIAAETRDAIDKVFAPDADEAEAMSRRAGEMPLPTGCPIAVSHCGVVQAINQRLLVELAERHGLQIWVVAPPGQFVPEGATVAWVSPEPDDALARSVRRHVQHAVVLGSERTMTQDPAFGFRQLVDIAERALSPGINDPTTAVQCLDQIHSILRRVVNRPDARVVHCDASGTPRVVTPMPTWEQLVALGFDEIRNWGARSPRIHRRVRDALVDLQTICPPRRRAVLERQLRLLEARRDDLAAAERVVPG